MALFFLDEFIHLYCIYNFHTILMLWYFKKRSDSSKCHENMLQWILLLYFIQCRYTLLLFLFEYRAATILIRNQFPGSTAAAITKFEIDNDVISLDGRSPLCTESEIDGNGRIHVRIRRSTSSAPESALSSSIGLTPRASNLSNAEIFSVNTPIPLHEFHHANGDIAYGHSDLGFGYRATSPRLSGYASSDAYSLQPTPRASNFNEMDTTTVTTTVNTPTWIRSPVAGKVSQQPSPAAKMMWDSPGKDQVSVGEGQGYKDAVGGM